MSKAKRKWTKQQHERFRATMAKKHGERKLLTPTIEPLGPRALPFAGVLPAIERQLVQQSIEGIIAEQTVPKRSVRMDFGDFSVTVDWKEK